MAKKKISIDEDVYDKIKKEITNEIYSRLEKNEPALIIEMMEAYRETTQLFNEMKNLFKNVEFKLKKIVNSPSLYEDVYKVRDELIELKKLLKEAK